ncbi:MAG: alpha/beta hydrolase [Myxococcales bacterium]
MGKLIGGREGEIELDGVRHAFLEFGAEDGPVVVCLHGWLDNAASFAPLAGELPGHRLLALELAGHGHSEHRPAGRPYHHLDWVLDVLRVTEALGLSRFALMGHSMGAGVAALVAGTAPERVTSLVLIEGTGPRPTEPEDVPRVLEQHLAAECRAAGIPPRTRPARFEIAVRARLVSSPVSRRAAELLALRGTCPVDDGVLWRNDTRLSHLQPMILSEAQILGFLSRIDAPTLLIAAEDGIRYNADLVAARREAIPKLTSVTVPGRHHVHMDDPAVVAAHVAKHLGETGS